MESTDIETNQPHKTLRSMKKTSGIQKSKHIETMAEVLERSIAKSDRPDARSSTYGVVGRPTLDTITHPITESERPTVFNGEALRKSVDKDWEEYERFMGLTKTFIS